jgi:UDP-N-acetylmuramoylalanine--D-glutamate ligase
VNSWATRRPTSRAWERNFRLGPIYLQDLDFDVIFRTPGLHPYTPELAEATERGCILTSEMEPFSSLSCRTVAIPLGRQDDDLQHRRGTPECPGLHRASGRQHREASADGNAENEAVDFAFLELSSFHLHSMNCSPDIAVVTNLSPNHLMCIPI